MTWTVTFCDEFELEFEALNQAVQDELLAQQSFLLQVTNRAGASDGFTCI